jgi:hypothetical protein
VRTSGFYVALITMASLSDYRLACINTSGMTSSGETITMSFKALVYSADKAVFWELRRFVLPLLDGYIKEFKLHKIVKDQDPGLAQFGWGNLVLGASWVQTLVVE